MSTPGHPRAAVSAVAQGWPWSAARVSPASRSHSIYIQRQPPWRYARTPHHVGAMRSCVALASDGPSRYHGGILTHHRGRWRCPLDLTWTRGHASTAVSVIGPAFTGVPRSSRWLALAPGRLAADGGDDFVNASHPRHPGKHDLYTGLMLLHSGRGAAIPHHHAVIVLVPGVPQRSLDHTSR